MGFLEMEQVGCKATRDRKMSQKPPGLLEEPRGHIGLGVEVGQLASWGWMQGREDTVEREKGTWSKRRD